MYADYVIWSGGSSGPVDDFLNGGNEIAQWKGAKFFGLRDWTAQCNIGRVWI